MDFFTLQDKARAQTRNLALLFLVAVLLIVIAINAVAYLVVNTQVTPAYSLKEWLLLPYWAYVSLAVAGVILVTSLFRSWQLNASPDAIAKMVNATPVDWHNPSNSDKKLLNVVEEMSIASGVPVPKVFVMRQESGINAFVSGLKTDQITLVVTQGLLDNLTRHELQGVIAHEYSHVFHGDMQINVRLIGILAGILVIGQLGQMLLRSGYYGSSTRAIRSSSNNKSSGSGLPILAAGLGLMLVGYIGLFFGRLIKAAISRQREFLADASAIQYTRDPSGICGALNKISRHSQGANLVADKAEEMSHLCFGQAKAFSFSGLLATHPPLKARILALDPQYDFSATSTKSQVTSKSTRSHNKTTHSPLGASGFASVDAALQEGAALAGGETNASAAPSQKQGVSPAINKATETLNNVGAFSPIHLSEAQNQIAKLPAELLALARAGQTQEFKEATECDLLLALYLANRLELTTQAITNNIVAQQKAETKWSLILSIVKPLQSLNFTQHHMLLDIVLTRFDELPLTQKRHFIQRLVAWVKLETSLNPASFLIFAACNQRAKSYKKAPRAINRFNQISQEVGDFLSLLYRQSRLSETENELQFSRQLRLLGVPSKSLVEANLSTIELAKALDQIGRLHPLLKKDFMRLCVEIVESDDHIDPKEYELLRMLGEYLACPLPLAIPGG